MLKIIFGFFKNDLDKIQLVRLIKNFTSHISLNAAVLVSQLAFPPLMIFIYGFENFGVWIFLTSIPSMLLILNFDINGAANIQMSLYFNEKNEKKISEIFTNSIFIGLFIISLLIVGTFLLLFFYDFDLKILKRLNNSELKSILFCIFFSFYINLITNIFKIGLSFRGKMYLGTYIETFFIFFSRFLIIILSLIFGNLLFAAMALLISNIIRSILIYYYFITSNKNIQLFSIELISKKKMMSLLKLSVPYYLETLNNLFKHSFQIIILGIFFNAQIVGTVSTIKTLFYFLPMRLSGTIANVLSYEFTKYYAEKKLLLLNKMYKKIIKITCLGTAIFIITSVITGEFIYNMWIKSTYAFDYILLVLIIFDISFFIIAQQIAIVNKSINEYFNITAFGLFINICVISISVLFFLNEQNYHLLFFMNLIGSIIILFFNIINKKKY